jgi:DNA primase
LSNIIPQESIEQVRISSDVVDVISGYVTITQKGRSYFGLCPFHNEKTPSFSVNPEMQIFHCFGCGAGGNVFTFVMRIDGLTFPEAVKQLAQSAGIILPEEQQDLSELREKEALFYVNNMANEFYQQYLRDHPMAKKAREYLTNRSFVPEDFKLFSIGYAPDEWDGFLKFARKKSIDDQLLLKAGLVISKENDKMYDRFRGRITFSIHNISNQVVGFGARRLINDNSPKYINSPETDIYKKRYILYGLNRSKEAIRAEKELILVEGYTDIISLNKMGFQNVAATSGTSLTQDHAKLIRRFTSNVNILYDSDSAGASAAMRGADLLLANGVEVKIAKLPIGSDPDDYIKNNSKEDLQKLLTLGNSLIDHKLSLLEDQGMLKTTSQRVGATRGIIESISKNEDQLKRSFLIKELAQKLDIEESVLWSELAKFKKPKYSPPLSSTATTNENTRSTFFKSKRGSAELSILEAIIINPENIPLITKNLHSQDFSHPEIKSVINKLEMDQGQITRENIITFASTLYDSNIAEAISQAISNDNQVLHTTERLIGYIKTLQISHIDDEITKVREQIKFDEGNSVDLKTTFNDLQKHRKEIKLGKYIQGLA